VGKQNRFHGATILIRSPLANSPASRFSIHVQGLEASDIHRLNAALGWLGLGCPADARAELDAIAPAQQSHPDVLEARWAIHAGERQWEAALDIARKLLSQAPERADGWLHHAYALRRTAEGGLEKAWEALKPAADKFPKEPIIPYNLSCYACQMRQLDEARVWLKRALKIGGKEDIKRMALADPDLEPLWEEIRQL
jgi:tetratricopeptide (TPR) repeat protein